MSLIKLNLKNSPKAVKSTSAAATQRFFSELNAEQLFSLIQTFDGPSDLNSPKDIIAHKLLKYLGDGQAEFKVLLKGEDEETGAPSFNTTKIIVKVDSDWGDEMDYYETKADGMAAFNKLR